MKACIFISLLVAQPNYKMSFLHQKKTNGGCITQKALPVLAPAIGPLILLFSGSDGSFPVGKKPLDARRNCFFFWGGGGSCTFQPSLLLKFRSTPLPPRISNLIYKYTSISLFLGIRIPCGTKFLREFIFFRIGDFLSSERELIFAIRSDWFFLLGVNFCDFLKVLSTTVCVSYV